MLKNKKMLGGAVTLGAGTFIAKILGALYRIPLTNMIGSYGLGLYQMVFPLYTVLLDFSGAGVPSALSKLISSSGGRANNYAATTYLGVSLKIFAVLGFLGSVIMAAFSGLFAKWQGDAQATIGYVSLAPAVLGVCIISCYRGYFQGLMEMRPTAFSQITEQTVKLAVGLLLVWSLMPDVRLAVAGATFAITVSEAAALVQLYLNYKKSVKKSDVKPFIKEKNNFRQIALKIIVTTVPVTLTGIAIPLSHVIDSFQIINVLSLYRADATSLFGLLTGVTVTVINLPVSVCYGVAATALPSVASATDGKEKNRNSLKALLLTLAVSLPCALFCFLFPNFIIGLLFKKLAADEKIIAVNLLRLCSPCVVLLSVLQTSNAVLIGKNRLYTPFAVMLSAIALKAVINAFLLKNPALNIYGGAVALIACYFFAGLLNFILVFTLKAKDGNKKYKFFEQTNG